MWLGGLAYTDVGYWLLCLVYMLIAFIPYKGDGRSTLSLWLSIYGVKKGLVNLHC